ncbi:hypothetical protein [Deinococcus rufus]|uniref:DUF2721 domain-containing protein n=1 Tax=Deinococcus rufus TaxID=2136097 RepID=A0ABV7Z8Z1_9DEIO
MDWLTWVLGFVGTVVAGLITNALSDAIKKGRRWLQEWSRERATRAALDDAQRAARLAGQTQRLVAWSANIILSALMLFSLIGATLLFSQYVDAGLPRTILHICVTVLIIMLAVFLGTAIRILDQVLEHIRQQDDQNPPSAPPGPLPPPSAQPAAPVSAPTSDAAPR